MRDAISILERCVQDGDKEIVDSKIKDLVGIPKIEYINKITESIIEENEEKALITTEEVINDGKDLYNFLWEIIKYIRDILIYKVNGKLNLYNEEELTKVKVISEKAEKEELFNIISKLSELENDIKWSTQKNIMFETGILKLIYSKRNKVTEDFINRLDILEKKISSGNIRYSDNNKNTVKAEIFSDNFQRENKLKPEVKQKADIPKKDIKNTEYWKEVVNNLKGKGKITLFTNLMNAKATEINDMQIGLSGVSSFGKRLIEQPENEREISRAILEVTGREMHIKIDENIASELKTTNEVQSFDMPINIIDE